MMAAWVFASEAFTCDQVSMHIIPQPMHNICARVQKHSGGYACLPAYLPTYMNYIPTYTLVT